MGCARRSIGSIVAALPLEHLVSRWKVVTKQKDTDRRDEIVRAVENVEISSTDAWSSLDALATHVIVEGVDVDPESIIFEKDRTHFKGALNIYLTLEYGSNNEDGFSNGTSFWGTFEGHFEGNAAKIDRVSVNTESFYQ